MKIRTPILDSLKINFEEENKKNKLLRYNLEDILYRISNLRNDEEIEFWNNIKPVGREYW